MITVEDFKNNFTRDFPYLPVYEENKVYFIDDIVYVAPNFYKSLVDDNTSPVTDMYSWQAVKMSTDNYLQDSDIEKAIAEANLAYPSELFSTESNIPMLYLTAYYLVVDIRNATTGLSSNGYAGFVASKSVGSVSESYGLPAWVNNDPMYALYLENGYGKKYLTYLIPAARTASIAILSKGATTL